MAHETKYFEVENVRVGREGDKCVGETAHEGVREREGVCWGVYALVARREGVGVGEHMLAWNKLLIGLQVA